MYCSLLGFDCGHPRKSTCTFYTSHTTLPKSLRGLFESNWAMLALVPLLPNLRLKATVWRHVHAQVCRRRALLRCLQFVSVDEFQRPRRFGWSCVMREFTTFRVSRNTENPLLSRSALMMLWVTTNV